ncbi:MAG: CPBP family intramembrane metalloprotease [Ruminococcus sp.]|nr:CPBP family intramembrane metalloprotease [Candidatus Apopatosoma intestinale]
MSNREELFPKHPLNTAPAGVIFLLVLSTVLSFLPVGNRGITRTCLFMIAWQVILFGVPFLVYGAIRPTHSFAKLFHGRLTASAVPIIVFGTLMLILQSCVLRFGVFYFGYRVGAYSLYGSSFDVSAGNATELAAIVLAYAVVPAILEEIFFRGIMMREYRIGGFLYSTLFSSLLFAVAHLDPAGFPITFCAGLTLSLILLVTGSLAAAMAAHAAYNLFVIFLEKYVWLMSSSPDSELLFWLILIALFLLCAFFFFRLAGAEMKRAASSDRRYPSGRSGVNRATLYRQAITAPTMIACLAIYAVAAVLSFLV